MKHPTTGKFLIELVGVASADLPNHPEVVVYTDPTSTHPFPAKYATSEDAAKLDGYRGLVPYAFNDDNDPVISIDYEDGVVYRDERGGWGRTYKRTFSDMEDLAKLWEVEFDVGAPTEELAEISNKLTEAEHMRFHGLSYEHILPAPKNMFLPPLPEPEIDSVYFTAEQMYAYGKIVKAS